MSARTLRSASATDLECHESLAVDGSMMCAICLESFDTEMTGVSTLPCNHKFCATCLVPHLLKDPRCPCCRSMAPGYRHPDELGYADSMSDGFDLYREEPVGMTIHEGVREARKLKKTDKRIEKQCNTMRKWEKARSAARKRMMELHKTLSPLEDKVDEKIAKYSDKVWDAFDAKHKELIDELEQVKKDYARARTCWSSARFRLARKGGFTRHPWLPSPDVENGLAME